MAKGTTAFGILFELKDKASKGLRALTSSIDPLAAGLSKAKTAADGLDDALSKGKVKGMALAAQGLKSLGKSMLRGSGGEKGDILGSVKDLVESVPYLGPIVSKSVGFLHAMMQQIAELRGEQNRWQVSLSGLDGDISGLTVAVGHLSGYAGEAQPHIMKLARSIGDVAETSDEMADGAPRLLAWTQNILELRNAFGLTEEEAAGMTKTIRQMGVDGGLEKFGGELLHLQKTLVLPELLQDVPEIMDMVFKSGQRLGTDFRKNLQPTITNVGISAKILADKFNLLPKAATKAATTVLGQFQEMAFNVKGTMLGVEESFDPKFQTLLMMGEMVGKNFYQVSDAMNKVAETGKWDDLSAMFAKLKEQAKGNQTAAHLIHKMRRDLGLDTVALLDSSVEALAARKQLAESPPLKPEEEWRKSLDTIMNGADAMENKIRELTNKLVTSASANMPEMMKKLEQGMGLLTTAGNEATTQIGKFFAAFDKPMAEGVENIIENYVKPAIRRTIAWFKEQASAASIDFGLGSFTSDLKEVVGVFSRIAAEFRRIGNNIRDAASWVPGLGIKSAKELAAQEAESARAEQEFEWMKQRTKVDLEHKAEWDAIKKEDDEYKEAKKQLTEEQGWELLRQEVDAMNKKRAYPTARDVRAMITVKGTMPDLNGASKLLDSANGAGSSGGPVPGVGK